MCYTIGSVLKNGVIAIDDFVENASLQKLLLKGNRIFTIEPEAFSRLTKLTYLDLSENKLRHLGDYIFDGLDRLRYLFLDGNNIDSIDRYTFHQMKQLLSLTTDAKLIIIYAIFK